MQMDFSLPRVEEGRKVTLPPFSTGSLSSQQPPVKTHDHHSFSLYHHNVPRPRRLTISYTLKFMTSSQCRNWFSMLWFPLPSTAHSDFYFWWHWENNALNFLFLHCSITFDVVESDVMVLKEHKQLLQYIWHWTTEHRNIQPTKWLEIYISTSKCYNKCAWCLLQSFKGTTRPFFTFIFIWEEPEDYALQWFGIGIELITGCLNKALLSEMTGRGDVFDR